MAINLKIYFKMEGVTIIQIYLIKLDILIRFKHFICQKKFRVSIVIFVFQEKISKSKHNQYQYILMK